jgi:hypothetical protein
MVGMRAASPRHRVDVWSRRDAIHYTPVRRVCKSLVYILQESVKILHHETQSARGAGMRLSQELLPQYVVADMRGEDAPEKVATHES